MVIDAAFLQTCAPDVPKAVTYAIVKTESNFMPYAIGVNGGNLHQQPVNQQQAIQVAQQLLAQGKNIDLGLAQINSNNLDWLGLNIQTVFNPCDNLRAMQKVYLHCLDKANKDLSGKGTAMQRAFSCYNTGNTSRGFSNGYVVKVTNHYNTVMQAAAKMPAYAQSPSSMTARLSKKSTGVEPVFRESQNFTKSESVTEDYVIKVAKNWDIFSDFID